MKECICCSDRLIKHLSHNRMYWFCPSCHQEMICNEKANIYSLNKSSRQKMSGYFRKRNWNNISA